MAAMTGLLLLLWAGVAVGSVVDLQKRIIGGAKCLDSERQYHVILISRKGIMSSLCGGSLVSNQWVLTAAHCWKGDSWTMTAHVGRSTEAKAEKISDHVIYKDINGEHDIMLVKLACKTKVPPVGLPDCKAHLKIGSEVQIAGHASTDVGPNNARGHVQPLQCAKTDLVDCDVLRQCTENNYPESWRSQKYQHWLCYKREGVDAAPGDSGGGLVFNNRIHGVISFTGDVADYACGEAFASMDVCQYEQWIVKTTHTGFFKGLWSSVKCAFGN
ncbi:serine protease 1-like [Clinocottus analis]|uniref:serine protease 1-like n=1 Tax=Clinocottus analis TaxID=304258 RepID=UPI0035BF4348